MMALTPAFLVTTASAFIGLGEDGDGHHRDQGHGGRGAVVDRFVRQIRTHPGGSSAPWDAAFVHHVGYWSHFDHDVGESSWPFPAPLDAHSLASYARTMNILDVRPDVGDLFVLWSPAKRCYVHTGIVLRIGPRGHFPNGDGFVECDVLSANVRPNGRIGGPSTLRVMRRMSPIRGDRFIRWTGLEPDESGEELDLANKSPLKFVDDEYNAEAAA